MRRSPRVWLLWSAALAVALLTARSVGGDLATLHRRAHTLGPARRVVVAARDLPLGRVLTAADLRTESRYASAIPREAVTDLGDAVGHVVVVPLLRDAIVFGGHLADANRTPLDAVVPRGYRAVHVAPKDGYQPPLGAIVDVLAAFDPTAVRVEGSAHAAVVVAAGARVLAVDNARDTADGRTAGAGVTLLVTDSEARVLAFAAANGDLTFAVDPPESACCRSAP